MSEFPQDRPVKTRKLYCLGGVGTSVKFNVHNNSLANLRRGLIERVFFVKMIRRNWSLPLNLLVVRLIA